MSNSTTNQAGKGYIAFEQHRRAYAQAVRVLGEEASLEDLDAFVQGFVGLPIALQARFASDPEMTLDELVARTDDPSFYDVLIGLGIDV